MTALTFVVPGQGVAQEQNAQPGTHAMLTGEAFSKTLTAALRQFEQAARRANPDPGPTLKASFLRAAFTNAGVPIAFVRRFGERPTGMVTFDDLSAADANSSMAPLLRGALGCEQLDSACAQTLDREFRDLLEPTARALFTAQTLFTELDECLQARRCDAASPEDQRLLHEAETFVGQTDLPQVFRALAVANENRMRLPGAIECVLTVPLDLRDCRDPMTAREERDASRNRDHGSRIPGPSLAIGNGTVNDEGDIPPDAIFLPPIEKEPPPDPEPDPSFTPPSPEDPCQAFGPGCGDPGDLVAAIDPKCPPGSEFKEPGCGPTEGGGGGTPRDMGPMGPIEGVGRGGGEVGGGRVRPGGGGGGRGPGSMTPSGGPEPAPSLPELAEAASRRVIDILRPDGTLIGQPGTSRQIRIIQGGLDDSKKLFDQLVVGGSVVKASTFPGTLVELPGGIRIGLRAVSASGPPTIDIFNVPGLGIREIKFVAGP